MRESNLINSKALEKAKEAKLKEAKEAKEDKEAKAKEAKEVKEAEETKEAVLSTIPEANVEANVVLIDKDNDTISEVQRQEIRRHSKRKSTLAVFQSRSERDRKLAASQQSPFQGNSTTKVIIPNTKVGHGYDPFALPDKKKTKGFTDWLEKNLHFRTTYERKPKGCPSYSYHIIRSPLLWLLDTVSLPESLLRSRLTRRLISIVPIFCASNKVWGVDDDIYAPVNLKNSHWFAIWILIPKIHIVVWDIILKHISPEELDEVMELFLKMAPYLLVECASSDEEHIKYTLKPFIYERVKVGVPQCRGMVCTP
ncbi:hypothetical protein N665_0311s0010 [Sinapis alba]|nr:hypothetical protein N665_0311s0010 [Sinapis alba]